MPRQRVRLRARPHAAVGGLEQPLGDRARRPRVGARHELGDVVVEQVALRDLLVHPVLGHAGRRVVAEQVVDGGGELGGALVAVADHRRDPARVGDARAEDAPRLLGQAARDHARGVGAVAQVGGRLAPGERAHGRDHAAVVLVVVVGVEDVVLARVDVLDGDLDAAEAVAHRVAGALALEPAAVGEAAPGLVDLRRCRRRRASRARRRAAAGRRRRCPAWSRRRAWWPGARPDRPSSAARRSASSRACAAT